MGKTLAEQDRAVKAGYWHLFRYNPQLGADGKNPFVLESKEPSEDFVEFISSETRYAALNRYDENLAKELFSAAAKDAKEKYEFYKKLSDTAIF
jgi:pyruvate-ferredoxin/flavodoxin oxidoreductase